MYKWECPRCKNVNDSDLVRCACGYEDVPAEVVSEKNNVNSYNGFSWVGFDWKSSISWTVGIMFVVYIFTTICNYFNSNPTDVGDSRLVGVLAALGISTVLTVIWTILKYVGMFVGLAYAVAIFVRLVLKFLKE